MFTISEIEQPTRIAGKLEYKYQICENQPHFIRYGRNRYLTLSNWEPYIETIITYNKIKPVGFYGQRDARFLCDDTYWEEVLTYLMDKCPNLNIIKGSWYDDYDVTYRLRYQLLDEDPFDRKTNEIIECQLPVCQEIRDINSPALFPSSQTLDLNGIFQDGYCNFKNVKFVQINNERFVPSWFTTTKPLSHYAQFISSCIIKLTPIDSSKPIIFDAIGLSESQRTMIEGAEMDLIKNEEGY